MRTGIAEPPSGLGVDDLAGTAERAYCAALGIPAPGNIELWRAVAHWALWMWENSQGADDALPVAQLVRDMHERLREALPTLPVFDTLLKAEQLALEAACRHVMGAIDCDREDTRNMSTREASWAAWVQQRFAEPEGEK